MGVPGALRRRADGMTENLISVDQYHALLAEEAKRRNKYGAVAVIDDLYGRFDSTGEHRRWYELLRLQEQGVIRGLRRQVPYALRVGDTLIATYRADFVYQEQQGGGWVEIVEDFKGKRTEGYKLKAKLMLAIHGIAIRETGR